MTHLAAYQSYVRHWIAVASVPINEWVAIGRAVVFNDQYTSHLVQGLKTGTVLRNLIYMPKSGMA